MHNRKSAGLLLVTAAGLAMGSAVALAQPANDACANAEVIVLAANGSVEVTGSTSNATNDSASGNCGNSNATADVWYSVTVPANGTLTLDTCSPITDYPTVVSLRTNACPGGTVIAGCNDGYSPCANGRARVSLQASAGAIYRIRVSGVSGTKGQYSLTVSHTSTPNPTLGPDVITAVVTDVARYGTNSTGTITAYAVGTTSCNPGDFPVVWIDNSNYTPDFNVTHHPVIGQNMYRLRSYGAYQRFEQLGQSWLKHGFVSTNSAGCGGCGTNSSRIWRYSSQTYQSIGGDALGINCSDTYGASLNGNNSNQGAKNIVNAALGTSPFVRNNGTAGETTVRQRLQVPTSDVTGQPAGTRFFVEGHYVTADDAQFVRPGATVAINGLNNNSWREVNAGTINNSSPSFVGSTVTQQPAIFAWRTADPTVTLVSADHDDVDNPGTGYRAPNGGPQNPAGTTFVRSRFWVAGKVTDLGGGQWRYEYAVYNLNSDRSAQSFSVPFPGAADDPTAFTFHAPLYHSGEPYSNAPWTMTKGANSLTFSTETFAQNANANALRWDTMYNFGFTSNVPPTTGEGSIALFKPGTLASVAVPNLPVPTPSVPCAADFNNDGNLDPDDLIDYVTCFFAVPACAEADYNGDGNSDPDDLSDFITAFFAGC